MKYTIAFLTVLICSTISFSQDICAKIAEVERIDTRKVILTYDSPMAEEICQKLHDFRYIKIILDGEEFDYQYFNCDPETQKVVYLPIPGNHPDTKSYNTLKLAFPNGEFATYSPFTSGRLYSGNLLECVSEFPPTGPGVPTLSQWGLIVLMLLLGIFGFNFARQRLSKIA
jgi:hypothetical protein